MRWANITGLLLAPLMCGTSLVTLSDRVFALLSREGNGPVIETWILLREMMRSSSICHDLPHASTALTQTDSGGEIDRDQNVTFFAPLH
jgi:hypothetical protein